MVLKGLNEDTVPCEQILLKGKRIDVEITESIALGSVYEMVDLLMWDMHRAQVQSPSDSKPSLHIRLQHSASDRNTERDRDIYSRKQYKPVPPVPVQYIA